MQTHLKWKPEGYLYFVTAFNRRSGWRQLSESKCIMDDFGNLVFV